MSDPTDHLATVRAAIAAVDAADDTSFRPWEARDFIVTDRVGEPVANFLLGYDAATTVAMVNAIDEIAALADECERLRRLTDPVQFEALIAGYKSARDEQAARIATLEAELVRVPDAVAVIDGHAKRLCGQAGEHWTGDGEQLDAWAAKVHDALNHLRAGEDGAVIDGRAPRVATVGGLLATAPVGAIIAAMSAAHAACSHRCADHGMDGCMWCRPDAIGRAINRASNAAQAGRVVRGAPRTWAVRWLFLSDSWWGYADGRYGIGCGACVAHGIAPPHGLRCDILRPTWCPLSSLWIWSTAAHDPRGCGMPRAGEVQ